MNTVDPYIASLHAQFFAYGTREFYEQMLAANMAFGPIPFVEQITVNQIADLRRDLSGVIRIAEERARLATPPPVATIPEPEEVRAARELFGLAPDYSPADLRSRRKPLIKRYHPDGSSAANTAKAAQINVATDVLENHLKRRR